jgi:fucose 4-O-acetylase-like acetyltransferase
MFRRIYILMGISIFAVVLTHSVNFGLWALYAWNDRYMSFLPPDYNPFVTPQWFFLIFIKQFFSFCVPAFFFVSGFFVSYAIDRREGNINWATIKNRVHSLLIPFAIWTFISLVIATVLGQVLQIMDYIWPFLGINGYWFIPVLVIFYLTSRWVVDFSKKNWKLLLVITGSFQLLMIVLKNTLLSSINFPVIHFIVCDNFDILIFNFVFYFPFGVAFGTNIDVFRNFIEKYRWPLFFAWMIFFILCFLIVGFTKVAVDLEANWIHLVNQIVSHIYSILCILVFLAFSSLKIPFTKFFNDLSGKTYGVYLTHYFFMEYFSKFIYHFFPKLLYFQILFTFFNLILGLLGASILMKLVKISPVSKNYRYLFG